LTPYHHQHIYITMKLIVSFISKRVLCLWALVTFGLVSAVWAGVPQNDSHDNSVDKVMIYHQQNEVYPESIHYVSWTPVALLDNGHYKVTVMYKVKNRHSRIVVKKQIVIMDETGKILKALDCR